MKKIKISTLTLFVLITFTSYSQSHWVIGVGTNVVSDNGGRFSKLLNFNSYNYVPYFSTLSVAREMTYGFTAEAIGNYNKLWQGKLVNGQYNSHSSSNYFSVDLLLKYDFHYFLKDKKWYFLPLAMIGGGYSDRGIETPNYSDLNHSNKTGSPTFDLGVGAKFVIYKRFGAVYQSLAKFVVGDKTSSNHVQHVLTITYALPSHKRMFLLRKTGRF